MKGYKGLVVEFFHTFHGLVLEKGVMVMRYAVEAMMTSLIFNKNKSMESAKKKKLYFITKS